MLIFIKKVTILNKTPYICNSYLKKAGLTLK